MPTPLLITIGAVLSPSFTTGFSKVDAVVKKLAGTVGVLDKALISINRKALSVATSFNAAAKAMSAFHALSGKSAGSSVAVANNSKIIASNLALSRSYQRLAAQRAKLSIVSAASMRPPAPPIIPGVMPVTVPGAGGGRGSGRRMAAFGAGSVKASQLGTTSMIAGTASLYLAKKALARPMEMDTVLAFLQSKISNEADKSPEMMNKFRNEALRIARTGVPYSSVQIAEMMGMMAYQGMGGKEILSQISNAVGIGTASKVDDLAEIVKQAIAVTTPFGESIKRFGDMATYAADRTLTTLPDIAQASSYFAPYARIAKIGLDEMLAITGIISQSGIAADRAGTGLSRGLTRIIAPKGKPAITALQTLRSEMGMKAFLDAKGNIKPTQELLNELGGALDAYEKKYGTGKRLKIQARIFEARAYPAWDAAMKARGETMTTPDGKIVPGYASLLRGIRKARKEDYVDRQVKTQLDTLPAELKADFAELGTALDETYRAMRPTLRSWTRDLGGFLKGVTKNVQDDPEAAALKGKGVIIGGAVLAVGGALSFLIGTIGTAVFRLYQLGGFLKGIGLFKGAVTGPGAVVGAMGYLSYKHITSPESTKSIDMIMAGKTAKPIDTSGDSPEATKARSELRTLADMIARARVGALLPSGDKPSGDAMLPYWERKYNEKQAELDVLTGKTSDVNSWWNVSKNLKAVGAMDSAGNLDKGITERMIASGVVTRSDLNTLLTNNPLIDKTNQLKDESVGKLQSILAVLEGFAKINPPKVMQDFYINVYANGVQGTMEALSGSVMQAVRAGAAGAYNGPLRPEEETNLLGADH